MPNIKESIERRKKLWERLEEKVANRNWKKPLVWFHVASAGEFLQAQPVINRCAMEGVECILTYSSINAFRWLKNPINSKVPELLTTEFLPYDTIWNARRLLGLLQPSRLVWISYDLWPNLVWEAHLQKIPQLLISAIVHENSLRTKSFFGRSFYKSLYICLEHILTVSEADSKRILSAIPEHKKIKVMGETRCDSVLERKESLIIPELPQARKAGFVFVAGSTWPRDESCIFPGLKKALQVFPELFLIIAPHEPTEKNLKKTELFFKEFQSQRSSKIPNVTSETRILLVDSVGILAGLYHYANMVYVGGAFTSGVHNVLEPAIMGATISFGPKHSNSIDAIEMIKNNVASCVINHVEFRNLLFDSISNKENCFKLGKKSFSFVKERTGATEQCFPLIIKNLS